MADGWITIKTALDTKEFDVQIRALERDLDQMERSYSTGRKMGFAEDKDDLDKLEIEIEKTKNKLISLKQQKEKATQTNDIDKMKQAFSQTGSTIQSAITKVAKLTLGIFGVRSAYMALRRASSDLANYDDQYSANLDYIRFVLTQAIAPVLKWIVEMAMRLLQYINMIVNALFGVNLFSSGSAENFKKMKASAGGVSKAVKEIRKQLLGFDEVNILTEQSDTGTGAGAGGVTMPDFDLSELKEAPKWLQKLIDILKKVKKYWKEVITVVVAFASALLAIKITNFISSLLGLGKVTTAVKTGIGLITAGIVLLAGSIINLILNWDNMTSREKAITVMLAVVGASFIALGYAIATGISIATLGIGALIALVVSLIATITAFIIKMANEEKAIKSVQKAQEDLTEAKKEARKAEDEYISAVDRSEQALKDLKDAEDKTGLSGEELNKQVERGILDYKDMTDTQREVYKAYIENKNAQDDLKEATDTLTEAKKTEKIASWDARLAVAKETGQYNEYKKAVVEAFERGELSAEEARDQIGKAMSEMSTKSQETFMEDLPSNIKEGLDPKNYQTTWQKFTNAWNNFWDGLKKNITMWFNANFSSGRRRAEALGGGRRRTAVIVLKVVFFIRA